MKEIFEGLAAGDRLPSEGLRKRLAKASGKSVRELEDMYNDVYGMMHDTDEDQFVPPGPIRG